MPRLQLRIEPDPIWTAFSMAFAIACGLALSILLLVTSGADAFEAFRTLWEGAFGSWKALATTLIKATPIILTGLAVMIAFRARLWSIGQEGQVYSGAIAAYVGGLFLSGLPLPLFIAGILVCGMAGGVLLGGLSAVLKNRFAVSEIVSTVMLNYLMVYLLSYLVSGGPLAEVGIGVSYQQSAPIPNELRLPQLFEGSRLHIGVLLPIPAAIICHVLLSWTARGYEIRAMGFNPVVLEHKGTDAKATVLFVLCLSGALAALAGAVETYGVGHRLKAENLIGLGYVGIIVAMIGGLTPAGVIVAGLVFGGLASGAVSMRVVSDVPAALVPAMEGIMLLCFLCAGVLARYQIRWGASV